MIPLARIHSTGQLILLPEVRQLAFVVSTADAGRDTYVAQLAVAPLPPELAAEDAALAFSAMQSPTGAEQTIGFEYRRVPGQSLAALTRATDGCDLIAVYRPADDPSGSAQVMRWTPEGLSIPCCALPSAPDTVFAVSPTQLIALLDRPYEGHRTRLAGSGTAFVSGGGSDTAAQAAGLPVMLSETPAYVEGEGMVSGVRCQPALISLVDGGITWLCADPGLNVESLTYDVRLGRGTMIAESYTQFRRNEPALYVFSSADWAGAGPAQSAVDCHRPSMPADPFRPETAIWLDDQALILFGSDMRAHGLNQDIDVWRLSTGTGRWQMLTPRDGAVSVMGCINSDVAWVSGSAAMAAGGSVYWLGTAEGESSLYRSGTEGPVETLLTSFGCINDFCVSDHWACAVVQHWQEPQQIRINGACIRLNAADADTVRMAVRTDAVSGWAMLPKDYLSRPAASYPAVLYIHGGPKTAWGDAFLSEVHALTAAGFAILMTNPPGSEGFGRAFSDIRGRYGTEDAQYCMDFTAACLAQVPQLDAGRLAVWGGSYGGYLSAWLCGHSDRFRAACVERPVINWLSLWSLSDIGWYFTADQTQADIWQEPMKLWDQSPLKYVPDWRAPTLIIEGASDWRCPAEQGRELLHALHYHGVEADLRLYPGIGHELSRSGRPSHRADRLAAIIGWFDRHLNGSGSA